MKYLLMCCIDESEWMSLPDSQRDEIMSEYGQLIHELATGGQLLGGARLNPSATAISVRHNDGHAVLTDGPFAETKEQLGGYHLVECRNQDEAVALAQRIPTLPVGGVIEVREIVFTE